MNNRPQPIIDPATLSDEELAVALPSKWKLFSDYHLQHPTWSHARCYEKCGYNTRTRNSAESAGHRLSKKPLVKEYIRRQKTKIAEKIEKKHEITVDNLVRDLIAIKDRCMQVEPVYDGDGNEIGEYVFKGNDALSAIKMLGQALHDLWTTRKVIGDPTQPINIQHVMDGIPWDDIEKRKQAINPTKH